MTTHLQVNGTIGAGLDSPVRHSFPDAAKTVWVSIVNGSQVPVVLTVQGGPRLYPPFTVQLGQPFLQQFTGKLFSIAGATAIVQITISDEKPEAGQTQQVSQATGVTVGASIAFVVNVVKTLYTVPAGYRFYLAAVEVTATSGDPVTLSVSRVAGSLVTSITGANPLVLSGPNATFGVGPGDTVTFPSGPVEMLAGDTLSIVDSGHGGTASFEGLLEPL